MNSIFAEKPRIDNDRCALAATIDEFCGFRTDHSLRVALLVDSLASASNLAERDRQYLKESALLRDIGEMAMRREYIMSPRGLTMNERIDLERHPVIGERESAKLGVSRAVQLMIRWHHEWWNGSGYPDGLASEQIPLAARILRVADTYMAMTSPRPFRGPVLHDDAVRYLREWAGIEFDPQIVMYFLSLNFDSSENAVNTAGDGDEVDFSLI